MALIPQDKLRLLVDAILASGRNPITERNIFFQSANGKFFCILSVSTNPRSQLTSDRGRMNEVKGLADGQIPLLIYLQNVAAFVSGLPEEKFIRSIIDLVINTTSGAKRPDIKKIPELKEAIIHTDDTVGFAFMQKGLQVAQAVVKLQVPSYFQSMPRLQSNGV